MKKELNILIGSNIKRERVKAGFTQEQFSEKIGIGVKSLSAVERGTVGVSISTLIKMCEVLSISTNSLLFESSHKNDIESITERLENLSPAEFEITNKVLCNILDAFNINK